MPPDDPQRDELREQRLAAEAEDERRAGRQRTLKLSLLVGLTAILAVVVLIVVSQSGDSGGDTDVSSGGLPELAGLQQQGDTVGDPDAPVTIVEFGDLQCPVCKAYSEQVIPEILAGPVEAGEAKLQFRNWVIIGPDSRTAAIAALAAGEQDRMWDFVTPLLREPGHREQRLRHRRVPAGDRRGGGPRHRAVGAGPRRPALGRRARGRGSRGGASRVRRDPVDPRQGAGRRGTPCRASRRRARSRPRSPSSAAGDRTAASAAANLRM